MLEFSAHLEYKKNSDIHGVALYPAVMVAPVQKQILKSIIESEDISTIFDPFHGSGTALYEAKTINPSILTIGYDINPLAHLITISKLQGIDPNCIADDLEKMKKLIKAPERIHPYSFPRMDKWLRSDVAFSIAVIRSAIISIESKKNRQFLWCILSDTVRKFSNTRSSTYKLHVKPDNELSRLKNGVIPYFISRVDKALPKFNNNFQNFKIIKTDTLKTIKLTEDNSFDLSITSPPYGDNKTTVPYGEFSMLPLYSIPVEDLVLEGWEMTNYSSIDIHSLGGSKVKERKDLTVYERFLLKPYLTDISQNKHVKVISFFEDYFTFLENLSRVTKKYIVLTLGNRTVDRVKIDLTNITISFLEENGYKLVEEFKREIPKKRIPCKTSIVKEKPVNSMGNEFTIILRKL